MSDDAKDRIGRAVHELRELSVHVEGLDEVARALEGAASVHIEVAGLRDGREHSLVRVIGEVGEELSGALKDIAYALRGLPEWSEPDR
jgi:hypothetical protein